MRQREMFSLDSWAVEENALTFENLHCLPHRGMQASDDDKFFIYLLKDFKIFSITVKY